MARNKGIQMAMKAMRDILSDPKATRQQRISAAKVIAMVYVGKKKVKEQKESGNLSPLLGK